ncbi:hypothetical protein CASFOL_020019 [Castilleja foliolosa]|uniref:DUF674 family protein n=1 Tax=Castilleja foliolosa TaxID=1961234 RepID=A0ABD3D0H6_9LAMI
MFLILKKHYGEEAPVFGSITTLYDGLSNLDSSHFWTEGGKQMLLNPTSSFIDECRQLKLDVGDNQPIKYFTCENWNCSHRRSDNLGMYYDTVKCDCGKQLKREIPVRNVSKAVEGGVFTKSTSTFIISDDLQILPNVTESVRQIVSGLGLMDIDGTELRNVTIGSNEIMELLKHSLFSSTPLTDLVLKKQTTYKQGNLFYKKTASTFHAVKFLKVVLQKSTKKFLFAEADEDFVEFLFSFLAISLGGVEVLLGINTSLKNIDNIFRSIMYHIDSNYLCQRRKLIRPTIPYGYLLPNWLFSLTEEGAPKLLYSRGSYRKNEEYLTLSKEVKCVFKSPRGNQVNFLKGPRKYMVKDDLTVIPLCMELYVNTLDEQKISLSDVEEASSILKASLSSTSALSIGLKRLIKKRPKQEQCA